MKGSARFTLLALALAAATIVAVGAPAGLPQAGEFVFPPKEHREPPPAPDADVLITIDADGELRPIDPRIYSFNLAQWGHPRDHMPEVNETFVAMVKQLRPAMLRWPAGHWSQSTCWQLPNAPACSEGQKHVMTETELTNLLQLTRDVGAEPLIGVNIKTGTPEQAAAVAQYLRSHGHAGAWYELGNEPDLNGGRDTTPSAEADRFHRFAGAIRAADPDAKLVGGVVMTGAHVAPWGSQVDWMSPMADGIGDQADAYSWHWYPLDSDNRKPTSGAHPTVEHLLAETASDWHPSGLDFAERACTRMEQIRDATGAEHWITELGPDSGAVQAPGITDGQVAAVWIADALPRLAECGADAVFQFALRQQKSSNLILMRNDHEPTPMWASYQLMSQNWRGTSLECSYDNRNATFAAHAARDGDGNLAVILVNKGAEPMTAALRWDGAYPESAVSWTIEADGPTATMTRVNGEAFDRADVIAGPAGADTDPWGAIEVPPYGVVVLRASP